MADASMALAVVYGVGVLWGLVAGDAKPVARLGLALAWPIGPLAFVVTVAILLASTPIAFLGRR
jgi:hypothetical protein